MRANSVLTRSRGLLAGLVLAFAPAQVCAASPSITFCNQFPHTVFVAIAYPQSETNWMSRGWLEVATGGCSQFDVALRPTKLYYRGESESYSDLRGRSVTNLWGKGRMFSIWEDSNFNYWNAQGHVLKSTLVDFSLAADTISDNTEITVTFELDGLNSTVTIHRNP